MSQYFSEYKNDNILNDKKIDLYYDKYLNEYIPLANIHDYQESNNYFFPKEKIISKDYLLQFYIGSIGLLGIIVLYKFYEKS